MATASSPSDQAANLLESLSLVDSVEVPGPARMDFSEDNSTFLHNQGYHYMPSGTYPFPYSVPSPTVGYGDQLYGTESYQYPGLFDQLSTSSSLLHSTSQSSPFKVEVSTSATAEKVPLSVETSAGKPNDISNTGSVNKISVPKPFRPGNNNSSMNLNGSYQWGDFQSGFFSSSYQDPRFTYDGGYQSPVHWSDPSSMYSTGSSRYATDSGFFPQLYSQHTRPSFGFGQASGYMNMMYPNNRTYGQYGGGGASYNYLTNRNGWVVVDNKYKPRGRGFWNENSDGLSELNKGPRNKGSKNRHEFRPISQNAEEQDLKSTTLVKEQYNREDLCEDYLNAKFFVIKSFSEDDVHKSIKYGVWTSTPNGNKKLDSAYHEAKSNPDAYPVFLLFSVNASGQFVGLAEMIGPVDFDKTVEYWQQDKWNGCFSLKWHIIKDVPNSYLRHITLENNENKPVTNSRDTQEVGLEKGVQILKLFKAYKNSTSILDDFEFYAHRERIIQEKKAKQKIQKWVPEVKSSVKPTVNGESKEPESRKESSQEEIKENGLSTMSSEEVSQHSKATENPPEEPKSGASSENQSCSLVSC